MSALTTSIRHCTTRLARVFRQEKYKEIKFERKNKTVFYRFTILIIPYLVFLGESSAAAD